MANPPIAAAPKKGRLAFLTTTAGVVTLSALLIVGSGIAYMVSQSSERSVGVVQVFVSLSAMETQIPADFSANPISLPHCSQASFDATSRRLTLTGVGLDAAVKNVVLVRYTGFSLSFGGDNTQVTFLNEGAQTDVSAAYSHQTVLYSLAPGTRTPFIPGRDDQSSPLVVHSTYTVQNAGNFSFGFFFANGGNMTVTEVHTIESYGGVRVTNAGGGMCA